MKYSNYITILVIVIASLSAVAAAAGIFSSGGTGPYEFESIHGHTVIIHGEGIYRHMSQELAPQGIAQDVVTLFLAVPCLILALFYSYKRTLKGRILLAGLLLYFLVTYLLYITMGAFNPLFLLYAVILSCSFFAFILTLPDIKINDVAASFMQTAPQKFAGGFLIFCSLAIALLWLQIVLPAILEGTVPRQVEHYTTLIVQGLDLSLFLPAGFVSGLLLYKKKAYGYFFGPVYLIFLSFLMLALTAKVIAIGMLGGSIIPVIFIIPAFAVLAVLFSFLMLKHIK